MTVVGVDACRKGWVIVSLEGGRPTANFVPTIGAIVEVVSDVSTIAIDIPIGLPETGWREADRLAREMLGPRRNSVFPVPIRDVLMTEDFGEANQLSVRRVGSGLSKQSHAIGKKILEVETWMPEAPCPVWEVHPEVCFRQMVGSPIDYSKKSWAGMMLRRKALLEAGIDVELMIDHAGEQAGVDDMLDAAAAAWSADRIERGVAQSLPSRPPGHPCGAGQTIWF